MNWKSANLRRLQFAASRKNRLLRILASASPSLQNSGFRSSSLGADVYTTVLTSTRGSKNISVEGGPERSIFHGP